jgi:hypothetical protein
VRVAAEGGVGLAAVADRVALGALPAPRSDTLIMSAYGTMIKVSDWGLTVDLRPTR